MLTNEFFTAIAEHAAIGRIDFNKETFEIEDIYGVIGTIEDTAVLLLLLALLLLLCEALYHTCLQQWY